MLETKTDLIPNRTLADGFTQSELSEMGRCAQKWNWRYNHRLEKAGMIQFPFLVGDVWHDAMEQFYATKGERVSVATLQFPEGAVPSVQDIIDRDYWNHVLPKMFEAYRSYYRGDHLKWTIISIEEELSVEYRGFRLRGKIDLTIKEPNGLFTLDHKTTSRLNKDIVAGWDFRFQFMFYLWLKWKAYPKLQFKGYYTNATKKPELRVKKNESVPEFAHRVFEDMVQEPDKYFYRDSFPVSPETLLHFQTTVIDHKLKKLAAVIDPNTPIDLAKAIIQDKNTDECQHFNGPPCPYLDLCRHGYQKMGFLYRRKENKHEELEVD